VAAGRTANSRKLLFEPACDGGGASGFMAGGEAGPADGPEDDPPEGGDPSDVPGGSSGEQFSFSPEGGGSSGLWLRTDDGQRIWFTDNGDSTYSPPPGIRLKLRRNAGPPVSYALTDAQQNVSNFNQNGRLESIVDASGNTITCVYGSAGRLQAITDTVGNICDLKYCSGRLSQVVAPKLSNLTNDYGRVFFITYNGSGYLEKVTRAAEQTDPPYASCATPPMGIDSLAITYSSPARFASISDYEGNTTTLTYQANGMVNVVSHPATYDYVTGQTVSRTRIYTFTTHAADPTLNPCGVLSTYIATISDERAGISSYEFDTSGRLLNTIDQLNRQVATLVWNNDNRPDSVTGPIPQSTMSFLYDTNGNTTRVRDPNNYDTLMEYNSVNNNLTKLTDPLLNVVDYQYSDTNNPTRPTLIDGPGTSNITLQYGQSLGADKGQPKNIQSPNATEQTFTFQNGFLKEATWGRKTEAGPTYPIQDGNYDRGPTGNPDGTSTHYYIANVCTAGGSCTLPDDVQVAREPEPGELKCPCEPCMTRSPSSLPNPNGWADQVCGEGGSCGGAAPNQSYFDARDGNGRPIEVRHYHDGATYTHDIYTYDARGRTLTEQRDANDQYTFNSQIRTWNPSGEHYRVRPSAKVERFYSDSTGRYKVKLTRLQKPNVIADREITTEYFTDAAGRVTEVKRDGVTVATYQYQDSTVQPAIKETKALSGYVSEFYVDKAGRVMKVVHLQNAQEILALHYTRDSKNRITEIKEYRLGVLKATTTYGYGSGNLTASDLDPPGNQIDVNKLYWNWLAGSATLASDPNRLVLEQRLATGTDDYSYRKEYWYDPGGNRLAMRQWIFDTQTQQWQVYDISRYNYSHKLSYDPTTDTGNPVPDQFNNNGDPITDLLDTATDYAGKGLDRLYSYHTYQPDAPSNRHYAVYVYNDFLGNLGRKVEYSNTSGIWTKKKVELRHRPQMMPGRRLLRMVREQFWRANESSAAVDFIIEWIMSLNDSDARNAEDPWGRDPERAIACLPNATKWAGLLPGIA